MVPLAALDFKAPAGGLPPIADWACCFRSIVFTGLQLGREPLDVAIARAQDQKPLGKELTRRLQILKGWTRASCAMLVCLAVAEMDVSNPGIWAALEPLHPVLDYAWLVPSVARLLVTNL